MTSCVVAERKNGVWLLRKASSSAKPENSERDVLRQAREEGRQINLASFYRLGPDAGVWQLELPKACLEQGEIALGLAARFVDRCLANPSVEHQMQVRVRQLDLRTVARLLQARGERVSGAWRWGMIDRLEFIASVMVASLAWLATLWQTRKEWVRPPGDVDVMLAVHGEWSNRTRHVLATCAREGGSATVLVLGRPRLSLVDLRQLLQRQLGIAGIRLLRPFSLVAAVRSALHGISLCMQGLSIALRHPFRPGFKELVAMNYRCLLGAASAQWWASGGRAAEVIYGHTGLADTTLLEFAQQASGAMTVHVVHGISGGLNFTGRSSVGWFLCEHDAHWHARLGGYGECVAQAASPPTYVQGERGLLFLSNHLHPMNPWFQLSGAADEEWSLRQVAEAADRLGVARSEVVWKPHPVFFQFDASVRDPVLRLVGQLGFSQWPSDAAIDHAATFNRVISTRSTIALDVLRLGVLPIILEPASLPEGEAISSFPLHATDAAGIVEVMSVLEDGSSAERLFSICWSAIGPTIGATGRPLAEFVSATSNRAVI